MIYATATASFCVEAVGTAKVGKISLEEIEAEPASKGDDGDEDEDVLDRPTIKKMAAYHQYYAVNAAVLSTIRASAVNSDDRWAQSDARPFVPGRCAGPIYLQGR